MKQSNFKSLIRGLNSVLILYSCLTFSASASGQQCRQLFNLNGKFTQMLIPIKSNKSNTKPMFAVISYLEFGSIQQKAFLYATPWSWADSLAIMRNMPDVVDVHSLNSKEAFTLAATVVHSWKVAENIFSPELINWALNNYSILDMSWVHLRERFSSTAAPDQRVFIHAPGVEKAYNVLSNRAEFAKKFSTFSIEQKQLHEILQDDWNTSVPFSKEKLTGYEVEMHTLTRDGALFEEGWLLKWRNARFKEKNSIKIYNLGLDAPFGMVLKFNDEPIAVVSFDTLGDALFINHIQGNQAKLFYEKDQGILDYVRDSNGRIVRAPTNKAIHQIAFRRVLIDLVKTVANEMGYKTVIIQGAYHNKWILSHGFERADLSIDKALAIYDETAQEAGAEKDARGNWILRIK